MEIAGEVELNIAAQNANEEKPVRCREDGSSLSKKGPEQVHTAKS